MKRRRTIEKDPIESEIADGFDEGAEFDGLADVAVRPEVVARDHIRVLAGRGEDNHGQHAGTFVRSQALQDTQAVKFGKLEVQQDHGGHAGGVASGVLAVAEQEFNGLDTVADHDDVMGQAVLAQTEQRQLLVVGIVFYQQNKSIRHHCPRQS